MRGPERTSGLLNRGVGLLLLLYLAALVTGTISELFNIKPILSWLIYR